MFKQIVYPNAPLAAIPSATQDCAREITKFLEKNPAVLGGLSLSDLRLQWAHFVPGRQLSDVTYIIFGQQVQGLEVAGTQVIVTIKGLGDHAVVAGISAELFPKAAKVSPVKSKSDARIQSAALSLFKRNNLMPKDGGVEIKARRIYPVNGTFRVIAEVKPQSASPFRAYIDVETLQGWIDTDIHTLTGRAHGRGMQGGAIRPTEPADDLPLGHLQINTDPDIGTFYTDPTGFFSIAASGEEVTLQAPLAGRWAHVVFIPWAYDPAEDDPAYGYQGVMETLEASTRAEPDDDAVDLSFDSGDETEAELAPVTAYYHVSRVHDWLKERGLGTEIDLPLLTEVNIPALCNAYYSGGPEPSLGFFRSGSLDLGNGETLYCFNSAIDTVIYHEYGHFVDDQIGGIAYTVEARGISEGWGDILAVFVSDQPHLAPLQDNGSPFLRTADNDYCYDPNGTDGVHRLGQAWAGFAWHLRENLQQALGDEAGVELAEELILPIFYANPQNPYEGVRQAVLRDDDDGLVTNGTPHLSEIVEAARRHCLETDFVPPPAIHDLRITSNTNAYVILEWSSVEAGPEDDLSIQYEILRSSEPITEAGVGSYAVISPAIFSGGIQNYTFACPRPGTHYFAVRSFDGRLRSSLSNVVKAEIVEPTQRPTFQFTTPQENALVESPFPVRFTVESETCLSLICLVIAGTGRGICHNEIPPIFPPYIFEEEWYEGPDFSGPRTLEAYVYDSNGQFSNALLPIYIGPDATSPQVTIEKPHHLDNVHGKITMSGNASDDYLINEVTLQIDGRRHPVQYQRGRQTEWRASLNTLNLANGLHTITATAIDFSGNESRSAVTVTVFNALPRASFLFPLEPFARFRPHPFWQRRPSS